MSTPILTKLLKQRATSSLGKKAEMGTLVAIIISIASFFILAGVMAKFLTNADDVAAENACRDSIALRAATAVRIGAEDSNVQSTQLKLIPPICKTIDKKVKGSREEIKKQIATKVARCWWEFGDGRYEEILKTSDTSVMPAVLGLGSSKNQCFVCYTQIIDQDKIEPDPEDENADCRQYGENCPISASEFIDYLYKTPYKTKQEKCIGNNCQDCETDTDCNIENSVCQNKKCQPVQTLSYLEYVQSYGGPGQVGMLTDKIEAGKTYAITFLPKNRPLGGSYLSDMGIGAAVGTALGVVCTFVGPCAPFALVIGIGSAVGVSGGASGARYVKTNTLDTIPSDRIFKEREYSSIYISDVLTAQHYCADGDILGK